MGGFPTIRHNEIHDISQPRSLLKSATMLSLSPDALQPLSGESMTARSTNTDVVNVRTRNFQDVSQDAFFDVRVFDPNTTSNCQTAPLSTGTNQEKGICMDNASEKLNVMCSLL